MNLWMFKLIPSLMSTQTPQGQEGGTVPNTAGTEGGTPAPGANAQPATTQPGTPPASAPGSEGVQPPAPVGGAASPTLGEIGDDVYYLVDPSRPDERILGSKIRESMHRARQVDNMQSRLHTSQTELVALKTQLVESQAQNQQFAETARLQQQLGDMGISPQGQTPVTGYQPPGTPPTPIVNPGDGWGLGDDVLGTGQPPSQNSALPNPEEFLRLVDDRVNSLMNQRLGNVNDNISQVVGESVGLVEEQRTAREIATRTFATSREADAASLRAIGVEETEISRIIDMGQQSIEKHQEAAILMGVTGPDAANSRELARLALVEAQRLNTVAAEARAQAYLEWENKKVQRDAAEILKDGYGGISMEDMPSGSAAENRLQKPDDIEAAKKRNLAKAKEIVAGQTRARAAAGLP